MASSDFYQQRRQDIETNIAREQKLLKQYEEKLSYTGDPREIAKINNDIERQKKAISQYQKEYESLIAEVEYSSQENRDLKEELIESKSKFEKNLNLEEKKNLNLDRSIQIFLAHAKEDKDKVIEIYDRLLESGYKPWLDKKNLIPGQNWRKEIPKAIKNSSIFLACFSSISVSKTGFIQRELKLALDRYAEMPEGKIYLIPLRLEECEIPELERDDLGIKLRDLHWLDYWEEDGFEILIRSLEFSQGRDPELKLRELRKLRDKIPQTQKFQQEINNIKIESVDVVTVNPQGQIIQKAPQQFKYFRENLAIGVDLELAQIPAGSFMMGTEDAEIERLCNTYHQEWFKNESPQHKVTVRAFWMSRYPITQAQWQVVAGWEKVEIDLDPDPSYFKEDYQGITRWNRPVECVSWNDAIEFCKRLSKKTKREYRLPSEAQWEYACRASTMTPFHFGETISTELANYDGKYNYDRGVKGKYREQTTPVGYFKVANNFGLYDMHGNVWEWCEDDWHDNYDNAPNDDTARIYAESSTKVIRGGSWFDLPDNCRSASRFDFNPGDRYNNIGFRVVRLAPRSS